MGNTLNEKRDRVWEVDALRGIMILVLMCYHLYYFVFNFCIVSYYQIDSYAYVNSTDPLHFWFTWGEDGVIRMNFLTPFIREAWRLITVDTFFLISGASCMFSRNNLRRGLKTLGGGLFLAAFTFGLSKLTGDSTQFIRFGVLMCYASCQLIYVFLLEKRSSKTLLLISIPVFIIGYFLRYHHVETNLAILLPFGFYETGAVGGDYWPILPMLGWFLLGVVLGRKYYSEKKSLFPSPVLEKLTRPLQWCGRWSGVLYIGHIVLNNAVFYGIGYIFGLLS